MSEEQSTILVVDDEHAIADLYTEWLSGEHDVRSAYNGTEALEELDESIDVVLLDRRMPDLTGDEVLERIRERGIGCRVSLVTAVDPDFDILEMGFDDYLVKPVTKEDIFDVVSTLLSRSEYDSQVQEFFSKASKKAALETEKSEAELDQNDQYAELEDELEALSDSMDDTFDDLGDDDFKAAFNQLSEGSEGSEGPASEGATGQG